MGRANIFGITVRRCWWALGEAMPTPEGYWSQIEDHGDLYASFVVGLDIECRGIYHRADAFGVLYSLVNQAESFSRYRIMNIDLGEGLFISAEKANGCVRAYMKSDHSVLCSSDTLSEKELSDCLSYLIASVEKAISQCGVDISKALSDYPPIVDAEYWLSENEE